MNRFERAWCLRVCVTLGVAASALCLLPSWFTFFLALPLIAIGYAWIRISELSLRRSIEFVNGAACVACAYDMTGRSGEPCPECGQLYLEEEAVAFWRCVLRDPSIGTPLFPA